ncbi:hypothetical protein DBR28_09640 [Chryseobacterium sp. HMWF028]|nr:hypothetical protein DBR28_09640 [Chryseobacterium sp. HMWF028]
MFSIAEAFHSAIGWNLSLMKCLCEPNKLYLLINLANLSVKIIFTIDFAKQKLTFEQKIFYKKYITSSFVALRI